MRTTDTTPEALRLLCEFVCQSGGAQFQGIQKGFAHLPTLILLCPLNVPDDQRTTGSLKLDEFNTDRVREKVAELRARFQNASAA